MNNDKINKYLFKKMHPKGCWHEWKDDYGSTECKNCGLTVAWTWEAINPDLRTAPGFFELWDWAAEKEWWGRFQQHLAFTNTGGLRTCGCPYVTLKILIDYSTFPGKVVKFLEERKNE